LIIKNKYNIELFNIVLAESIPSIWVNNTFTKGFNYLALKNLILKMPSAATDISVLKTSPLEYLNILNSPNISGDIAILKDKPLTYLDIRNTKVNGNIANIKHVNYIGGNQKTQTTGELKDIPLAFTDRYYTNGLLSGSIEDYVSSRIDAGQTSITDRQFVGINKVTFGTYTFTSEDPTALYSINWTSNSHIWVVVGSKIYAKGATAEEISAWEGQGKTVIVIS
jgi:hypothetical protein